VQVKPSGSSYLIRLERGEQALESLRDFADRHRIGCATIRAIGTLERVTLGYYDALKKTYQNKTLDESLEVLNLSGNIAKGEDGERIVHAHVTVGRPDYTTMGGHVVEATVGPTLEVVIETMPMTVRRRHDPDTGLNLWDLEAIETVSV
jgi:predicted DNA-binding protein with PD1-like motif